MKELIEQRNDLITRAEDIVNAAKVEERALTDAEAQEVENINAQVRSINKTIELEEQLETNEKGDEPKMNERELNERKTFEKFIRGEINERTGELTPAASGDNIGLGAVLIPTTIAQEIVKKIYDISPVLEESARFNVKGNLEVPYYPVDASITVAYATEFSPLSSSTGSFAAVELKGFLAGALTKISRRLINNSQFDVVDFVVNEMALQIARFIEKEMLVGTSEKVLGMSTLTNGVTAAASNAITANELIEVQAKVKDIYQAGAMWIMSVNTRTALRELKDNEGRYLLNADLTAPFGYTLLGKPVYASDSMPEIGASKAAIYYGDFSGLASKFSEEISIEVLRELYAAEHAVGVVGWVEFDSAVINQQKLAKLTMGTTSV